MLSSFLFTVLAFLATATPREAELAELIGKGDVTGALRAADLLIAERERSLGPRSLELAQALDAIAGQVSALEVAPAKAWVERQLLRSLAIQDERRGAADPQQAATVASLSDLCFALGKLECSEKYDRRLLDIRRRTLPATHPDLADSNRNVGGSLMRQSRLTEARTFLAEAVRILERADPPRPLDLAAALESLAECLRAQNLYREAEALFTRALAVAEGAVGPKDPALVPILINLGGLHKDTNRLAEAHWRLRQALEIEESSAEPRRSRLIALWNNLAELLRLEGDAAGAEAFYRKSLDAGREVLGPDHPWVGIASSQLAVLLAEQKRFEEAEALYVSALAIKKKAYGANHPDVAQTHHDLGRLFLASGRPRDGRRELRTSMAMRERTLGPRHPDVAVSLIALAESEETAKSGSPSARTHLDRALRILAATPAEKKSRATALAMRARLRYATGQRRTAMADLGQALDILDGLRPESGGGEQTRSRFLADTLDEFHRMLDWKLADGDVAGAFAIAERARARALLDQLAVAGVDLRAGIPAAIRERLEQREAELRSRISELKARLQDAAGARPPRSDTQEVQRQLALAQQEFERAYEETKNASPRWRGRPGGALATLDVVQREVVPAQGLLLFYVVGREKSVVFVVPRTGRVEAHALAVPSEIAEMLGVSAGPLTRDALARILDPAYDRDADAPRGVLERLASPRAGPLPLLERALHALWRILVPAAVASRVSSASEVVLVPDGLLNRLPFEALVMEPGNAAHAARYWIDGGPVVRYAASANALLALTRASADRPPDAAGRILSVSDPEYGSAVPGASPTAFERLPGTAREADALREAFGERVVSLAREAAREERVVRALPTARYLHLAAHGVVDESGGGLFAALALTPPPSGARPGDDGQLQLHEIHELQLDADLAVLSACESRSGNVVGGEGVFALSRAFLAAGARRVVASLWPADDGSTSELMSVFFRNWAGMEKEGRPPDFARALSQARRAVHAEPGRRHPFYWAAFVLEGPR